MSAAQKGNKNFLGKHHSEETKIKISDALGKRILCIENNKIYKSLHEAAKN